MKAILAVFLGLLVSALAASAAAQSAENAANPEQAQAPAPTLGPRNTVNPAPQARENAEPVEREWYGGQTLMIDVASIATFATGLVIGDGNGLYDTQPVAADALATLGIAGYVAGAPTVHVLHHRPLAGLGSLGLRAGLPLLGGAIGLNAATCPPPSGDYGSCGLGEAVSGFALGLLSAIILDASVFAWETPKTEAPPPSGPTVGIAPSMSSDGKRSELRVFGTF